MITKQEKFKCSMFPRRKINFLRGRHVPCSVKDGFSLIEIIVAIGIVSVGIISIISLFSVSLKNEIRSKNKVIAVYLAQEALEVVRWQRDTNWKNSVAWDRNFDNIQSTGNDGISGLVDIDDVTQSREIKKVTGVGNQHKKKVCYKTAGDYYAQRDGATDLCSVAGWENTGFTRWLPIASDCGIDCLTVTAYVSHPNLSQDVQMSTRLYDWMP